MGGAQPEQEARVCCHNGSFRELLSLGLGCRAGAAQFAQHFSNISCFGVLRLCSRGNRDDLVGKYKVTKWPWPTFGRVRVAIWLSIRRLSAFCDSRGFDFRAWNED
jgi:hypothetical protein